MEQSELKSYKRRLARLKYLLVALPPFHRDETGQVWLDPLWHRDLIAHLDYLSDLTVLSEREPMPPNGTTDLVRVDPFLSSQLTFCELPPLRSKRQFVFALPRMAAIAFKTARRADVVHSGIAGWPAPLGLVVNPWAVIMGRPLVIVVESAPWRLSGRGPHLPIARLRAYLNEAFGRWSIRQARLTVFTQPEYRETLSGGSGETILTPASLLDDEDVLSPAEVDAAWASKGTKPRFVLAGRLIRSKGIEVFLDALRMAEAEGLPIDATLIGTGEMQASARDLAAQLRVARLNVLEPITYGSDFLSLLRGFHVTVVPTLSDEQPRILFDSFSQGVPVLASDTAGNRGLVIPGESGWIVRPADAVALLQQMRRIVEKPEPLASMGLLGQKIAARHTRRGMHLTRARRLAALFGTPLDARPGNAMPMSPVIESRPHSLGSQAR